MLQWGGIKASSRRDAGTWEPWGGAWREGGVLEGNPFAEDAVGGMEASLRCSRALGSWGWGGVGGG